ncbi:MAG: energy transducer TonB [Pirellulales bacterium]
MSHRRIFHVTRILGIDGRLSLFQSVACSSAAHLSGLGLVACLTAAHVQDLSLSGHRNVSHVEVSFAASASVDSPLTVTVPADPTRELEPESVEPTRPQSATLPSELTVESPSELPAVVVETQIPDLRPPRRAELRDEPNPIEPTQVTQRLNETRPRTMPATAPGIASSVSIPQSAGFDEDTPADLSLNVPPKYPAEAVRRKLQGTVTLRLVIDELGAVTQVEVARTSGHSLLDDAAVSAVRHWHAVPATHGGRHVSATELLPIRFRL